MSAKSSREIPSGFLVDGPVGFLGCSCDGPAVEEEGKERIERTSAAEAAMVHVRTQDFKTALATRKQEINLSPAEDVK